MNLREQIQILPAEARHIPAIAALEQLCFSKPWSADSIRSELENPLSVLLAAFGEGTLLGYIGIQIIAGECYISNLAVTPARRGQGIGGTLLRKAEAKARAANCAFLSLEVRESNRNARNLYDRHGFLPVGRRRNYYQDPNEDALILTKYLIYSK